MQEIQETRSVGKMPWRRKWQPTAVFLPGESHGQRGLVGYSPQGRTESEITDHADPHFSTGAEAGMKIRKGLFLSFF